VREFDVIVVKNKISLYVKMTPCNLVQRYQYIRGIYLLCVQNKTSTINRRADGACFFAGEGGLIYSTKTGNRKELGHSNIMDRDGKMGEKNVRPRRAGESETCWF
jgi:hypothetical protein